MPAADLVLALPARSLLLASGGALVVLAAVTLSRAAVPTAEEPALAIEAREPVAVSAPVREVALEDEVEAPEAVNPLASIESMGEIEDPADFAFVVEIGGTSYVRLGHPRTSPSTRSATAPS